MREKIIDILHRYRRGEAGMAEDAAAEILALVNSEIEMWKALAMPDSQ